MTCRSYGSQTCDMCKECTIEHQWPCRRPPCGIHSWTCKSQHIHHDCQHYGDPEDYTPVDPMGEAVIVEDWNGGDE
jgi:hypothetical protein